MTGLKRLVSFHIFLPTIIHSRTDPHKTAIGLGTNAAERLLSVIGATLVNPSVSGE